MGRPRPRSRRELLDLVVDEYLAHEDGWTPARDALARTGLSADKFSRLLAEARASGYLDERRASRR